MRPTQSYYKQLREHLEIPAHLADRSEKSLRFSYTKYMAYQKAILTLKRKWENKELPFEQQPTREHVIETMQSKTFWYDYIRKYFLQVSNYPKMVEWLEDREDGPSDIEVWGVQKEKYLFGDLGEYLENKGEGLSEEIAGGSGKPDKGKKKAADESGGGGSKSHKRKGAEERQVKGKGKGKETRKK